MALFKSKKSVEKKPTDAPKKESNKKPTEIKSVGGSILIRQPKVSEKTLRQGTEGVYVFVVENTATKSEIKKQIERLYGVTVVAVRSIRTKKSTTFRGQRKQTVIKKVMATLKKGQSIDVAGNI